MCSNSAVRELGASAIAMQQISPLSSLLHWNNYFIMIGPHSQMNLCYRILDISGSLWKKPGYPIFMWEIDTDFSSAVTDQQRCLIGEFPWDWWRAVEKCLDCDCISIAFPRHGCRKKAVNFLFPWSSLREEGDCKSGCVALEVAFEK